MIIGHYTTVETAKKIIDSGCLLFNSLSQLNDPHEYQRHSFMILGQGNGDDINVAQGFYSQISRNDIKVACFTHVGEHDFIKNATIGPMWAHYSTTKQSSKGEKTVKMPGCVLLFDQQKLLEKINSKVNCITHGSITYSSNESFKLCELAAHTNYQDCLQSYANYAKDRYFRKDVSWSYESEYRFMISTEDNIETFLDFGDSLVGIAMQYVGRWEIEKYHPQLSETLNKSAIKIYYAIYDTDQNRYLTGNV